MGFFESEAFEAAPAPRPTTSAPPRRPPPPASRPAGGGSRGAARPPAPAPRPATSGGTSRPGGAPASRPASSTSPPASSSGGFDLGKLTSGIGKGLEFARFGVQIAQQFNRPAGGGAAGPPGPAGPPPGASDAPPADPSAAAVPGADPGAAVATGMQPAPAPAVGATGRFDQLAGLIQALSQRQIPPLPPPVYAQAAPFYPAWAPAPPADGMAALRAILVNPQFQQALQWSAAMGPGGPRSVQLPVPAPGHPGGARPVDVPLGAVMNAIASLAGQSMGQLNAGTREDEPEVPGYLVDEQGEFVVDPASAEERAALVAHLFRMNEEAHRSGWFRPPADAAAAFHDGTSEGRVGREGRLHE
jgi:hypothetical protein